MIPCSARMPKASRSYPKTRWRCKGPMRSGSASTQTKLLLKRFQFLTLSSKLGVYKFTSEGSASTPHAFEHSEGRYPSLREHLRQNLQWWVMGLCAGRPDPRAGVGRGIAQVKGMTEPPSASTERKEMATMK